MPGSVGRDHNVLSNRRLNPDPLANKSIDEGLDRRLCGRIIKSRTKLGDEGSELCHARRNGRRRDDEQRERVQLLRELLVELDGERLQRIDENEQLRSDE